MTNKTEMLLAPRELLEKLLTVAALSASAPYRELRALLDAPAEDVRAVVDEPVAYVMPAQIEAMKSVGWMHAFRDKGRAGTEIALYLKPPIALAKPDIESEFEKWWQEHGQYCRAGGGDYEKTFAYRAYEACLDEFARLNK